MQAVSKSVKKKINESSSSNYQFDEILNELYNIEDPVFRHYIYELLNYFNEQATAALDMMENLKIDVDNSLKGNVKNELFEEIQKDTHFAYDGVEDLYIDINTALEYFK